MPKRGEVWLIDFGITQKVRPALIISIPYGDAERALIGVVPHTTTTRGSQFEVAIAAPFLARKAPSSCRVSRRFRPSISYAALASYRSSK